MLTTSRSDRRNRRQAIFTLESLDDRLVLSAGAGGAAAAEAAGAKAAAVEHRQEVKLAKHEAKLARMEAKAEAKAAKAEMKAEAKAAKAAPMVSASVIPVTIGGPTSVATSSPAATAAVSTSSTAATTASTTTSNTPMAATPPTVTTTNTNAGTGTAATVTSTGTSTGTTTSSSSSGSGTSTTLPSNVAAALNSLYQEYESQGGGSSFTPGEPSDNRLVISGTSVEVSLKIGSGTAFSTALAQLQSDGMQVASSSSSYGLIQGMLPIADLPAAAQVASSVSPISPP